MKISLKIWLKIRLFFAEKAIDGPWSDSASMKIDRLVSRIEDLEK
jgi:hypothetical protein